MRSRRSDFQVGRQRLPTGASVFAILPAVGIGRDGLVRGGITGSHLRSLVHVSPLGMGLVRLSRHMTAPIAFRIPPTLLRVKREPPTGLLMSLPSKPNELRKVCRCRIRPDSRGMKEERPLGCAFFMARDGSFAHAARSDVGCCRGQT